VRAADRRAKAFLARSGSAWEQALSAAAVSQVTQLGHVKDLATAFVKVLDNDKASKQVYNISGERFVTFDGIAKACAAATGAPEPELVCTDRALHASMASRSLLA
jgi:nucleoside-diphosphate-sugar epimerase